MELSILGDPSNGLLLAWQKLEVKDDARPQSELIGPAILKGDALKLKATQSHTLDPYCIYYKDLDYCEVAPRESLAYLSN